MTDKLHIRKSLRVIDGEVDPEQVIFAVNPGGNQSCYIYDGSELREITFGAVNNVTAQKPLVVAAAVATIDPDLERFSGTATAGSGTTITLPTGATESSDVDDFHNGSLIQLTGGTGAGQNQRITDYDGTTRVATVTAFAPAPDATTTYEINCTNLRCDSPQNAIGVQWGLVRLPFAGQNVLGGDVNKYPYRFRIWPKILGTQYLRFTPIRFMVKAIAWSTSTPELSRWEWQFNYKNIPSRLVAGPYLLDEQRSAAAIGVTAAISDVVFDPSGAALPGWLEFTLTLTSSTGIAAYSEAESLGIS